MNKTDKFLVFSPSDLPRSIKHKDLSISPSNDFFTFSPSFFLSLLPTYLSQAITAAITSSLCVILPSPPLFSMLKSQNILPNQHASSQHTIKILCITCANLYPGLTNLHNLFFLHSASTSAPMHILGHVTVPHHHALHLCAFALAAPFSQATYTSLLCFKTLLFFKLWFKGSF